MNIKKALLLLSVVPLVGCNSSNFQAKCTGEEASAIAYGWDEMVEDNIDSLIPQENTVVNFKYYYNDKLGDAESTLEEGQDQTAIAIYCKDCQTAYFKYEVHVKDIDGNLDYCIETFLVKDDTGIMEYDYYNQEPNGKFHHDNKEVNEYTVEIFYDFAYAALDNLRDRCLFSEEKPEVPEGLEFTYSSKYGSDNEQSFQLEEKFTLKGTTDVEGLPAKIDETSEASINVKDLVIRDLHYNFHVTGNIDDGFMTDEETFKIDYTYENKKGDIPSYDPSDFDEVE